uniref:Uncharacterized protein n=2 Tax=Parasteatoda tepidariorum TaxID=114398 RepID=A0A2L2Y672_PARTP
MESKSEESTAEIAVRQRKFGLPDWMVNNIERLNFATDFEQYACSPPETEGFLSDLKDSVDLPNVSEPFSPAVDVKDLSKLSSIQSEQPVSQLQPPTKLIINQADQLPMLHQALSNLKIEEFSSPDSTPCVTPEPSPVVRRKMSNPGDTVITNPGRWFYMGKVSKPKKLTKEQLLELKNKENKALCEERTSVINAASREAILNAKQHGIKLMISNFDLNAVSPTSW